MALHSMKNMVQPGGTLQLTGVKRRLARPLTRLQPNLGYRDLKGSWLIQQAPSIPDAIKLALQLARQFSHNELHDGSHTEVVFVERLDGEHLKAQSPSGKVERCITKNAVIDRDGDFRRIFLVGEAPRGVAEWKSLQVDESLQVDSQNDQAIGALIPADPGLFVGGLISLSAEPPEGFFAASTSAELRDSGYKLSSADEADAWLYRVPDSRSQSYFDFLYSSPDRPEDGPREGKFLIASGLGPASDPTSQGGAEADLLWLGDEQHGPFVDYLKEISSPYLKLSGLKRHQGLAQKLPDGSIFLNGIDKNHTLTREGFDALKTDPEIYRRVYSKEYDEFLQSLFETQPGGPAKASYLLATSRGCTQGCAICCSGGLKPFQSFSAERMMEELHKLASLRTSDKKIDVFFLDSNFNNNPKRLIEFAQCYSESELNGRFRFYVRHNTVKGFLKKDEGKNVPNIALLEAFKTLGIHEIFMGVDTFDEASTLTLKSNRVQLARRATEASATYTPGELRALIEQMEAHGLTAKAFYLQNNPWVTDYDRLESYFHIADLWFNFPHFSIDTRERAVNQLKPFAGSPVEQVNTLHNKAWTQDERFQTGSAVGELDELMSLSYFGAPQYRTDEQQAAQHFADELLRVQHLVEESGDENLIAKLKLLYSEFELPKIVKAQGEEFRARWEAAEYCDSIYREALADSTAPLFAGLETLQPKKLRTVSRNGVGREDALRVQKRTPKASYSPTTSN